MKCEDCLYYRQDNCLDDCLYKPINKKNYSKQYIENEIQNYKDLIESLDKKPLTPKLKKELRGIYISKIHKLMSED